MKKIGSKMISILIATLMLFNMYVGPVLALTDMVDEQPEIPKQNEKPAVRHGEIEVDVKFTLPLKNRTEAGKKMNINMSLIDADGHVLTVPFENIPDTGIVSKEQLGDQSISVSVRKLDYTGNDMVTSEDREYIYYYAVTFQNLRTGSYQVELSGNGYKTYQLNHIELDEYSKRITLSNETGLFEVGDVNSDNVIDQKDTSELIKHIGLTDTSSLDFYDLNRDGVIDLVDLTYIATSLNNQKKEAQIVNTNVIVDTTKTQLEGDIVAGTMDDLFNQDLTKTVTLGSTNAEIISENNPVQMELKFDSVVHTEQIRLNPNQNSVNNAPTEVELTVTTEDGRELHFTKKLVELDQLHFFTNKANDHTIVIDLGGQVAVKKVTIQVIKTANNTNLAEISNVEFLNNVYEEVPAPKMDIPTSVQAFAKNKAIDLTWNHASNVTGYEVRIERKNENSVYDTKIYQTTYDHFEIKELDNYTDYSVSIRSVNGEWKSPYSQSIIVTPIPDRLAPAPENVLVEGKVNALQISWKKMKDTLSYNLFYREKGTQSYTEIRNLINTSYFLEGLKSETTYEVYLTGNNHLGEGQKSAISLGKTIAATAPDTTNYKLINQPSGVNVPTQHIKSVSYPNGGTTTNSDMFDVVDNDYTSYWNYASWNGGGYGGNPMGPIVEFDQAYEMDHIIFVSGDNEPSSYQYFRLDYWDEAGVHHMIKDDSLIHQRRSSNGKLYYEIQLNESIKATKIQASLSLYWPQAPNARIRIIEMKFYHYDSIEHDIDALFKDDLHISLNDYVTVSTIDSLEERVNTKDLNSDEYHPQRQILLEQLTLARDILNDKNISDIITVDQTINNDRNNHLGFSMSLNDYQPLGLSVKSNSTITVYVGTTGSILPQLVFTQFNAESGTWTRTVNLVKGKNVIVVPQIGSMDVEHGGSIYVRYPSSSATQNKIQLRVSGAVKTPVLNLYGVQDETMMKEKIKTYIVELTKYVGELPNVYKNQATVDETGKPLDNVYAYHPETSVLNVTEIGMQQGLFSISASQALKGITASTANLEEQVTRLYNSVLAFNQMMDLFYQEKGLYANPDTNQNGKIEPEEAKHAMPGSRINIRQMRMFDGAFMYAGGLHIGIGSGSAPAMMQGRPNKEQNGIVTTEGFFGWGISHEIGHQIDEGHMSYKETTNNIFSLFAQTNDDRALSRLESSNIYPDIYTKVTSGTTGIASNVFVSLGMFWQLHLAYDDESTLNDQNSFYARLNRLYRATTLTADRDNLLIMLASDTVQKDLTDFFRAWGLTPSTSTLEYIKEKGYQKETRKIQYLNDSARRHRLVKTPSFTSDTKVTATLEQLKDEMGNKQKQIKLDFQVNQEQDRVLGYEILRNGVPIAFVTESTYTDLLGAINNRSFVYEVIAYDQYLNKTDSFVFDPIKVTYDGSINKANFHAISNMRNTSDIDPETDSVLAMESTSLKYLIDQKSDTNFIGNTRVTSTDKTDPYVILDFNQKLSISGIKYTAPIENGTLIEGTIQKYEVYISNDSINWTLAKSGNFQVSAQNPTTTIYFDKAGTTGGNQLWTYQASYLKIVAKGNKTISGNELDIIAPPGDNVELNESNLGILSEDYQYGLESDHIIPKGSIIFQGEYRGNPAYNTLLLIDETGKVANGGLLLSATIPENGPLDEIASGKWIFYMTPEEYRSLHQNIHANLYRVDDALTNNGQRLVSDTIPHILPDITALPDVKIEA